jgi:hypothetical protein
MLHAVYILDTGVRSTHMDFKGRIGAGAAAVGSGGAEDDNGHGTHVAGTAVPQDDVKVQWFQTTVTTSLLQYCFMGCIACIHCSPSLRC